MSTEHPSALMRAYRVVSEPSTARSRWSSRSSFGPEGTIDEDMRPVTTTTRAESIERALGLAASEPFHAGRRIVHVEEVFPEVRWTDAEISDALRRHLRFAEIDPEAFAADDVPLFHRDGRPDLWKEYSCFDLVACVAEAVDEQRLLPGLRLRCDAESPDPNAVVGVGVFHEPVGCVYRFAPLRDLTDDPGAIGWDGLLAVGRELLRIGGAMHSPRTGK